MRKYIFCFIACCFLLSFVPMALAQDAAIPHPNTYIPTVEKVETQKNFFDDPRPYLKTYGPKQLLPKAVYEKLVFNEDEMKKAWEDIIGFRAPNIVGKIRPDIKPGKYTYKDVQNNPGFKELMLPDVYSRAKPGGPPHGGNIPEFEIIPTRQYYWSLPVSEMTKKNAGKTKLDDKGFIIGSTWEGGYPFPRPSGKFKAQEIMYNVEKRYLAFGQDFYIISKVKGFTKNLKQDHDGVFDVRHLKLAGRNQWGPIGYFDQRAQDRAETKVFVMSFYAPRDTAGMAMTQLTYLDPNKPDMLMAYVPSMRRVRKMTASDSQDPIQGQDQIYDDNEGWMQKLSPTRYPYKFEVIDEREYLVVAPTLDGAEYVSSKGLEFKNVKLERRPLYVVKLTQIDSSYVYKTRIFYIDKETFVYYHVANYDQKGRLYRTWDCNHSFFPEMGTTTWSGALILMRDHVDLHSSMVRPYQLPALWNRRDVSLEGFMRNK